MLLISFIQWIYKMKRNDTSITSLNITKLVYDSIYKIPFSPYIFVLSLKYSKSIMNFLETKKKNELNCKIILNKILIPNFQ